MPEISPGFLQPFLYILYLKRHISLAVIHYDAPFMNSVDDNSVVKQELPLVTCLIHAGPTSHWFYCRYRIKTIRYSS